MSKITPEHLSRTAFSELTGVGEAPMQEIAWRRVGVTIQPMVRGTGGGLNS